MGVILASVAHMLTIYWYTVCSLAVPGSYLYIFTILRVNCHTYYYQCVGIGLWYSTFEIHSSYDEMVNTYAYEMILFNRVTVKRAKILSKLLCKATLSVCGYETSPIITNWLPQHWH
jgi:hypothetical protein